MNIKDLIESKITWSPTENYHSIFESVINGKTVFLKVNQSAGKSRYTISDDRESLDIEEKPVAWRFE